MYTNTDDALPVLNYLKWKRQSLGNIISSNIMKDVCILTVYFSAVKVDDFMRRLWNIYETVTKEGITQVNIFETVNKKRKDVATSSLDIYGSLRDLSGLDVKN